MKILLSLSLASIVVMALVGCGDTGNIIISGNYQMDIALKNESNIPCITFNDKEKTFDFTMDMLSSYIGIGEFSIGDNIITAVTYDDEPNTYIFEIIDSNTLSFDVKQSSKLSIIDDSIDISSDENIAFIKNDD